MPMHAEHSEFLSVMQDARLLEPQVNLGDLSPFAGVVQPTGKLALQ